MLYLARWYRKETETLLSFIGFLERLTNARDLGGYATSEGKHTKQGVIYRTSRLNENETTKLLITESGINEMVNRLKIKADLDIRKVDNNENRGITESPLGVSVNYYLVPMKSVGNCILLNKEVLKDAFAIFGIKIIILSLCTVVSVQIELVC